MTDSTQSLKMKENNMENSTGVGVHTVKLSRKDVDNSPELLSSANKRESTLSRSIQRDASDKENIKSATRVGGGLGAIAGASSGALAGGKSLKRKLIGAAVGGLAGLAGGGHVSKKVAERTVDNSYGMTSKGLMSSVARKEHGRRSRNAVAVRMGKLRAEGINVDHKSGKASRDSKYTAWRDKEREKTKKVANKDLKFISHVKYKD